MHENKFAKFAGIEVDGRNVKNVTDTFRLFPDVGLRALAKRGIGHAKEGRIVIDTTIWYPLPDLLDVFFEILARVGPAKVLQMGRVLPENAPFPPNIDGFVSAICALDIAYHINHRKDGKLLFDMETGRMTEAIGHYRCDAKPDRRTATMICDNPYPCDLDRGIIFGLGKRFGEAVNVEHDKGGCRKEGAGSCTYHIGW